MKTVVFTHNDLDGVACGIVALSYFPDANVHYCSYQNIESVMRMFIELHNGGVLNTPLDLRGYRLIISDISFKQNSGLAELINQSHFGSIIIVDHHKSSLWMNHYKFDARAVYRSIESDGDYSAAMLLNNLLHDTHYGNNINGEEIYGPVTTVLDWFSSIVSDWDTWTWADNISSKRPYVVDAMMNDQSYFLSTLMYTVSISAFVSRFVMGINSVKAIEGTWKSKTDFTYFLKSIFTEEELDNTRAVIEKSFALMKDMVVYNKIIHTREYGDIPFGWVVLQDYSQTSIASEYIKQTGMLKEDNKFLAMVSGENPKGVSLRLPAKGIDLSVIATEFGGGGHVNAAGCDYGEFTNNVLPNSDEEK